MFEKDEGFVGLLIGFGLGFVAAIILTKAKEAAPSTTLETGECSYQSSALSGWRPLSTIPSVDRLREFKPVPVLDVPFTEKRAEQVTGTSYKNSEKWIVKRDPNTNRILGYEIDRNAKIG